MPNMKICQRLRDKSVSFWCYLLNNEHQTSHAVGMMSVATYHNYHANTKHSANILRTFC